MCVQNFDDSRGLAIRITYRISLRSSSLWEPRHPLLKVVKHCLLGTNSKGGSWYPCNSDNWFFSGEKMVRRSAGGVSTGRAPAIEHMLDAGPITGVGDLGSVW